MTNPYYSKTGAPAINTQGRSGPIRDEFALIEVAFDDADTAIDLKAPLASPALTGTPTAPTAAVATDTTQIATTEFVQNVLGAAGALLPVQTTHAGKYLMTDGVSASWDALDVTWTRRAIFQDNAGFVPIPLQNGAANVESIADIGSNFYHCNTNFISFFGASTDTCYTSPDGITWTARTLPATAVWTQVAIVGTRILAGDAGTTIGAYSDDGGLTWTSVNFPATMNVLVGGAYFLFTNTSYTYYTSATGATAAWTSRTLPNPTSITPAGSKKNAFATGAYVWFGDGTTATGAARSSDSGSTWIQDNVTGDADAAATDGTNAWTIDGSGAVAARYSTDQGDGWTTRSFAANNFMYDLCYGAKFVAVGKDNATGYLTVNYTTGTAVWTSVSIGTTAGVFYGVAYNGSIYMAVGGDGSAKQAYTSSDAITWSATATVPAGATALDQVVYDTTNSKWIITAASAVWWSADDGATWTAGTAPGSFLALYYLNGHLLGNVGGVLYESTDGGSTWAAVSGAPTTYSIVYSPTGACYYVKGTTTSIWRSTNLTDWALVPYDLTSFKPGGTGAMFLKATYTAAFRSADGITWTQFTLPATYDATSIRDDISNFTFAYLVGSTWHTTANAGTSWASSSNYQTADGNNGVPFAGGYLAAHDSTTGLNFRFEFSWNGADWLTYSVDGAISGSVGAPPTWVVMGTTMVSYAITFVSTQTAIYSS